MPDTISLLLVDDQLLLREGMHTLLELEEDLTVVGESGDGQEAIALYNELWPDVMLMDVQIPKINGVDATRSICRKDPQAKVIILTTFDDDEYVFEGVRAGALGFLLKAISGAELVAAVRTVYRGGRSSNPPSPAKSWLSSPASHPWTTDSFRPKTSAKRKERFWSWSPTVWAIARSPSNSTV